MIPTRSTLTGAAKRFLTDTVRMRPDLYLLVAVLMVFQVLLTVFILVEHGDMTAAESSEVLQVVPSLFWLVLAIPVAAAVIRGIVRYGATRAGYGDPFSRLSKGECDALVEEAVEQATYELRSELNEGDTTTQGGDS